ncbi:ribonuclease III [bacterium]|nr:ribonuclease III [bacterium]
MPDDRISSAEALLGRTFADKNLLARALTHPSTADEPDVCEDYERLEFLGDAVLTFVVVDEVYRRFPDLPEGVMTKMKIALVSGATLSAVAEELGLAALIRVGQSEMHTARRGMTSALENVFEALVGALYLDGGVESVRAFVLRTLGDRISPEAIESLEHPKSILQEMLQARGTTPTYSVRATDGPAHDPRFHVAVSVDGVEVGAGSGRSKKEAESAAAADALESLGRS